ncbi:hypothetical protein [Pseudomonas amygdali]|nr:hypothetical protein [Pseudomonas amygdali]RMT06381.1 hypothetical protein ALP54_03733 [Pseudomonas amygdali pv. lachrymans]
MPALDLYRYTTNPSPEHLLSICHEFFLMICDRKAYFDSLDSPDNNLNPEIVRIWKDHPYDLLGTAETLAEQILGHFSNLQAASEALSTLCKKQEKLPYYAEFVFQWACLRDHSSLSTLLSQTHDLYQDGKDLVAIRRRASVIEHGMLSAVPRPTLCDENGSLKYNPIAFAAIHHKSLEAEIRQIFDAGITKVERLVSDFHQLDTASQKLLGLEIGKNIYGSLLPDDSPVRIALKPYLDDAQDAKTRVINALDSCLDATPENDASSPNRISHAFAMLDRLNEDQKTLVFSSLRHKFSQWLDNRPGGYSAFEHPDAGIPLLGTLLKGLNGFGFDALAEIAKHMPHDPDKNALGSYIEVMVDGWIKPSHINLSCANALVEAALIAADEKELIGFGLKKPTLLKLADLRSNAPLIRAELVKSSEGRELVFGADLGL